MSGLFALEVVVFCFLIIFDNLYPIIIYTCSKNSGSFNNLQKFFRKSFHILWHTKQYANEVLTGDGIWTEFYWLTWNRWRLYSCEPTWICQLLYKNICPFIWLSLLLDTLQIFVKFMCLNIWGQLQSVFWCFDVFELSFHPVPNYTTQIIKPWNAFVFSFLCVKMLNQIITLVFCTFTALMTIHV